MPARTLSDNTQSKYCFRALPLIYHPKKAKMNPATSQRCLKTIFFFEGKQLKRLSFASEA